MSGRGDEIAVKQALQTSLVGAMLKYLRHGTELALGKVSLVEPSLASFRDRHYLTIRNAENGYVTVSADGLNFRPVKAWASDGGNS